MIAAVIRTALAGVLTLGLAPVVQAAGPFTPPAGCEGYMTVQLKSCSVGNYFRCASDAPGDQWSTYFDDHGPLFTSRIDAETRWMQSYDHVIDEWDALNEKAADHASFTTLLETGRDDFDFTTTSEHGETRRYMGWDRLTGEILRIDGIALERTEFDVTAYDADGAPLWHRTGRQFIHREWRIFLADTETFESVEGEVIEVADTPIDFAFPGEPGFMTTRPDYGCDMMMTKAGPAQARTIQTIAFQGRP